MPRRPPGQTQALVSADSSTELAPMKGAMKRSPQGRSWLHEGKNEALPDAEMLSPFAGGPWGLAVSPIDLRASSAALFLSWLR